MAEPFSDEAMLFTKELVLQREVSGAAGRPSAPSVSLPVPTPPSLGVLLSRKPHCCFFYFHTATQSVVQLREKNNVYSTLKEQSLTTPEASVA